MEEGPTVEKVKHLWNTWDIRACILTSLAIQASLTFLAPLRKSSANSFLKFFMWLLYLSADAIAVFIIGLIASSEGNVPQKTELLAFWAPFLLLHLGGPDTITALALQDNELWHRHALQLATQVVITVYVFGRSIRHNYLLVPTMLMFLDGFIKYLERTCALYFASMDNFRDSLVANPEAGPNYARLMEEYFSARSAHIPTDFEGKDGGLLARNTSELYHSGPEDNQDGAPGAQTQDAAISDIGIDKLRKKVECAHLWYEKFKPLLAEGFLSLNDRNDSRNVFVYSPAKEAFEMVQIELNLTYDVFYTKLFMLQGGLVITRALCFLLVIASLVLFSVKDKSNYHRTDIIITFVLLGGAIALDICAVVMFVLSDWWIIIISHDRTPKILQSLMLQILRLFSCMVQPHRKRWSGSISKYNLLRRCFRNPPYMFNCIFKMKQIKRIKDILTGVLYVDTNEIEEKLVEFLIDELQTKARLAPEMEIAKEVCSARGNLVLQDDYFLASECLSPWTVDVDYDESLFIWHLATDICYWTSVETEYTGKVAQCRRFSKELSDYMSYLLLRQQDLVSSVVGRSDTRFEDTCEEAKKFMNYACLNISWYEDIYWQAKKWVCKHCRKLCCQAPSPQHDSPFEKEEKEFFNKFCEEVLTVKAEVQPLVAKGDKSKSVLFDACRLANQLKLFGENQWEITSKVWLELLCYAAIRCSPRSHIAQLSRGGELITLVWFYMAHLGLGERFLQNQGFGWTKLIIKK